MYNNLIVVTCILSIAIVVRYSECIKNATQSRYRVCSVIPKLPVSSSKHDLPSTKAVQIKGEWIKLNKCSVSNIVKQKLKELGIDGEFVKKIESENERKEAIESIINFVNLVYREEGYFNSKVSEWNYLDSGELKVECVEDQIPERNFRIFVKDENGSKLIKVKAEEVIKTSLPNIPTGKYTQQSNEYLIRKIFRGGKMSRFDIRCFETIRESGLYKNIQYIVHRDKDEVYLDFYHEGYDIVHSLSPTLSIRQGGPVLNVAYQNKNFVNTKSLLNVISELNLFKLLNYNHKMTVNVYSDILDYFFWKNECTDCTLVSTFASVSMNDVMALLSKLSNLQLLDKLKSSLKSKLRYKSKASDDKSTKTSRGTFSLEQLKEKSKNIKEAPLSSLKGPNSDGESERLKNSQLCVSLMKKLGNLKYTLSPYLGSADFGLLNQVSYKLVTSKLEEPVAINANLNNSYRYRDVEAREKGNEKGHKYRAETRLTVTLPSRWKLLFKYCFTNKMNREDYRGLYETAPTKPFLIASHDVSVPVTFKFKIVPYIGVFMDLLFPSKSFEDLDLSLGLKFTILNLTVSVPILNKIKSLYIFNKFSKNTRNYHIGI